MRALLLLAIAAYQRWISPHKGYRCAYGAVTGKSGCSGLGYRAIRRYGALHGLAVLRMRLRKCRSANETLARSRRFVPRSQTGFCDADVGGIDCGDASGICDGVDCCDLPTNWLGNRTNKGLDLPEQDDTRTDWTKQRKKKTPDSAEPPADT